MWKSPTITTSVLNIYCKPVDHVKASKLDSGVKVDLSRPQSPDRSSVDSQPYEEAFPDVTSVWKGPDK